MTFLNPLDALIPKIPFSFFPDFWAWVTSKAWGSDSVGFRAQWGRLGSLAQGPPRSSGPGHRNLRVTGTCGCKAREGQLRRAARRGEDPHSVTAVWHGWGRRTGGVQHPMAWEPAWGLGQLEGSQGAHSASLPWFPGCGAAARFAQEAPRAQHLAGPPCDRGGQGADGSVIRPARGFRLGRHVTVQTAGIPADRSGVGFGWGGGGGHAFFFRVCSQAVAGASFTVQHRLCFWHDFWSVCRCVPPKELLVPMW